jgi:hypothetical protein
MGTSTCAILARYSAVTFGHARRFGMDRLDAEAAQSNWVAVAS